MTFSQIVMASDKVDSLAFCPNICNFLTYYKKAKKNKNLMLLLLSITQILK